MFLATREHNTTLKCPVYWGYTREGATPPPTGEGTITLYDVDNINYTSWYFQRTSILSVGGCNYTYSMVVNDRTVDGMYKMIMTSPVYWSCPPYFPLSMACGRGFWLAISAFGAFAFVDTSNDYCMSFLGLADPTSSTPDLYFGTFSLLLSASLVVAGHEGVNPLGPGFNGTYNTSSGTLALNFGGCLASYAIDPSSLIAPTVPQSFIAIVPRTKAGTPFKVSGASAVGARGYWGLVCVVGSVCVGFLLCGRGA